MLAGRRVVLGVTGGVAAYKAAYLARRLIERGAVVRTVMTESAPIPRTAHARRADRHAPRRRPLRR
jgi:GDP-D-mannose dehydratase